MSFHTEAIISGDCAVLRITGGVDVYTAPELRQQVIDLVGNGIRHIVGDLRGVEFLDSTGLGVLVGSLKRLRVHQGSLTLVTSGARVLQLLQITGLDRAFELREGVLDAISADPHWQAALAGEGYSAEDWCRKHDLPQGPPARRNVIFGELPDTAERRGTDDRVRGWESTDWAVERNGERVRWLAVVTNSWLRAGTRAGRDGPGCAGCAWPR